MGKKRDFTLSTLLLLLLLYWLHSWLGTGWAQVQQGMGRHLAKAGAQYPCAWRELRQLILQICQGTKA